METYVNQETTIINKEPELSMNILCIILVSRTLYGIKQPRFHETPSTDWHLQIQLYFSIFLFIARCAAISSNDNGNFQGRSLSVWQARYASLSDRETSNQP